MSSKQDTQVAAAATTHDKDLQKHVVGLALEEQSTLPGGDISTPEEIDQTKEVDELVLFEDDANQSPVAQKQRINSVKQEKQEKRYSD